MQTLVTPKQHSKMVNARKLLAALDSDNRDNWVDRFVKLGGDVAYLGPARGYRAGAFGISSTSTMAPIVAVMNWMDNARKRLSNAGML